MVELSGIEPPTFTLPVRMISLQAAALLDWIPLESSQTAPHSSACAPVRAKSTPAYARHACKNTQAFGRIGTFNSGVGT